MAPEGSRGCVLSVKSADISSRQNVWYNATLRKYLRWDPVLELDPKYGGGQVDRISRCNSHHKMLLVKIIKLILFSHTVGKSWNGKVIAKPLDFRTYIISPSYHALKREAWFILLQYLSQNDVLSWSYIESQIYHHSLRRVYNINAHSRSDRIKCRLAST